MTHTLLRLALVATLMLPISGVISAGLASAHEAKAGSLTIIHPTARVTLPNRPMAAYMGISNDGTAPDLLLSASSPEFEAIELHQMKEENGVLKMLPLDGIAAPAEDTALLEPGGMHLMLFGAKQRFKAGDEFPLTLVFEHAGEIDIKVKVQKAGHGGHSGHSGHGSGSGN